jgi:hypothetical protein
MQYHLNVVISKTKVAWGHGYRTSGFLTPFTDVKSLTSDRNSLDILSLNEHPSQ